MQAGELPGQGNDGWREAVEGLEDHKSGVGCVELVVSLLDGGKEGVATGLFGAMACGDGEERGVRGGWRVGRCGGARRVHEGRLVAQDTPSLVNLATWSGCDRTHDVQLANCRSIPSRHATRKPAYSGRFMYWTTSP